MAAKIRIGDFLFDRWNGVTGKVAWVSPDGNFVAYRDAKRFYHGQCTAGIELCDDWNRRATRRSRGNARRKDLRLAAA